MRKFGSISAIINPFTGDESNSFIFFFLFFFLFYFCASPNVDVQHLHQLFGDFSCFLFPSVGIASLAVLGSLFGFFLDKYLIQYFVLSNEFGDFLDIA